MKVLGVVCGLSSPNSVSRILFDRTILRLMEHRPESQLNILDLSLVDIPHWSEKEVSAAYTPDHQRTEDQRRVLELSDRLCDQLKQAEILVIASPMWNFSIPSALKAWLDHVVRVGVTFKMGPAGPQGLLTGLREVYLIESLGGDYRHGEARALNHVAPYLENILRFLGGSEIHIMSAQGTAIDRAAAIQNAEMQIDQEFASKSAPE